MGNTRLTNEFTGLDLNNLARVLRLLNVIQVVFCTPGVPSSEEGSKGYPHRLHFALLGGRPLGIFSLSSPPSSVPACLIYNRVPISVIKDDPSHHPSNNFSTVGDRTPAPGGFGSGPLALTTCAGRFPSGPFPATPSSVFPCRTPNALFESAASALRFSSSSSSFDRAGGLGLGSLLADLGNVLKRACSRSSSIESVLPPKTVERSLTRGRERETSTPASVGDGGDPSPRGGEGRGGLDAAWMREKGTMGAGGGRLEGGAVRGR